MPVQSSTKRRRPSDQWDTPKVDAERPITMQNPLAAARGMIIAVALSLVAWVGIAAALLHWAL